MNDPYCKMEKDGACTEDGECCFDWTCEQNLIFPGR